MTYELHILKDANSESPREWSNMFKMIIPDYGIDEGDRLNVIMHRSAKLDFPTYIRVLKEQFPDIVKDYSREDLWKPEVIDDYILDYKINISKKLSIVRSVGQYAVYPIYLYRHGLDALSITPFSCSFDSALVGYMYCEITDVDIEYEKNAKAELNTLENYINGNVYGFQLYKVITCEHCNHKHKEFYDACWGFFGSDWKTNGIKDHLPSDLDLNTLIVKEG